MSKQTAMPFGVGKMLLAALLCLLSCVGPASAEFDPGVVKGQWGTYDTDNKEATYYFLSIDQDYSGVFIRSFEGDSEKSEFTANDVKFHDGFVEIRLADGQKAVLSAWKLKSGSGLLTGQVFMYTKDGRLFNMLYFPLRLLNAQSSSFDSRILRSLWEQYK